MPHLGNDASAILDSLSSFWLRFFRDIGEIKAAFEGSAMLMGQAYLDMLGDVLSVSATSTPLYRKEMFRLIACRSDQWWYRDTGVEGEERYVCAAATRWASIPRLQNKVWGETAMLEERFDYEVADSEIRFKANPSLPVPSGFASREVTVVAGGSFTDTAVTDWTTTGIENGDILYLSDSKNMVADYTKAQLYLRVTQVAVDKLWVDSRTPVPPTHSAAYSWKAIRVLADDSVYAGLPGATLAASTGRVDDADVDMPTTEVAYWAVDGLIDEHTLYENFGYMLGEDDAASSEVYRGMLRGIMQLYALGPMLDRMEAALNVVAGLPVTQEDDEVLLGYDDGVHDSGVDGVLTGGVSEAFSAASAAFGPADLGGLITIYDALNAVNIGSFTIKYVIDATHVLIDHPGVTFVAEVALSWRSSRDRAQTVTTSSATYLIPLGVPMRADVVDPASIGVLTFRAFEPLAAAIDVTDYIEDPEWWHNAMIPPDVWPGETSARRAITSQLYRCVIGEVDGPRVGDPGLYVGCDEHGVVTAVPRRHKASFILFNEVLKAHIFSVAVDLSIDVTGESVARINRIVDEVRPSHTLALVSPFARFLEEITVADAFAVWPTVVLVDDVDAPDTLLKVGSGGWHVGDGWEFTDATGGAITVTPGGGGASIQLVVGGNDPAAAPASSVFARALYAAVLPA